MKSRSSKSVPHVALMRGINVGGKNMLPMKDLAEIFAKAGCENVKTYIQSGNVIFKATPASAEKLPEIISKQIAKRFGFQIPAVIRTIEEIEAVFSRNPFLKSKADPQTLFVMFFADHPKSENVAALDPNRSPPDEYIVLGRDIYLRLANHAAKTKLTNAYFDSKLATVSTARNWRTVGTLLEMMRA